MGLPLDSNDENLINSPTKEDVVNDLTKEDEVVKKPKSTNYFDVREEDAVKAYLIAESKYEKEKIYNDFLNKFKIHRVES